MGNHRPYIRKSTNEQIKNNAPKDENGNFIDPHTQEVIQGTPDKSHTYEMENRGFLRYSDQAGMSQRELNDTVNNAGFYDLESAKTNRSGEYESKDENQTSLTTANYCYLENPSYQETTYICPPTEKGEAWSVEVENKNTREVSKVGTFQPDLSNAAAQTQGGNLNDFGATPTAGTSQLDTPVQTDGLESFGVSDSNSDTHSSECTDKDVADVNVSESSI